MNSPVFFSINWHEILIQWCDAYSGMQKTVDWRSCPCKQKIASVKSFHTKSFAWQLKKKQCFCTGFRKRILIRYSIAEMVDMSPGNGQEWVFWNILDCFTECNWPRFFFILSLSHATLVSSTNYCTPQKLTPKFCTLDFFFRQFTKFKAETAKMETAQKFSFRVSTAILALKVFLT